MKKITSTIKFLYLLLFFATPLIFTFFNSELFELPKMHFVYLITIIITCLHLINWLLGNIRLYQKNIFNLPLLLFLISQIICTFTSIDIYTSLYGYTSRLNGGLLSVISFCSLFWCLTPYLDEKFKQKIIDFSLIAGISVSIYGILEHFGIDQHLWVQDVQSRVFSTLGQPNWLAAYLCILLPFSTHKFLESKNKLPTTYYLLLTTSYYLTLLFTQSKSGIIAGIISISIFFLINFIKNNSSRKLLIINYSLLIVLSLLITNPIKDKIFPQKTNTNPTTENQNLNITSSEDIRKIVWRGSLDLFKKFPIFGTGVETFAYSYYWTRPIEHNLTSEWDFLYNKAHNEYLNYLATTGLVGTAPYLILIFTVLFYLTKQIFTSKNSLEIRNWSLVILSSYISILITNAAGFSVVTVSLFFFLLPSLSLPEPTLQKSATNRFKKFLIFPVIIFFSLLFYNNFSDYLADTFFAKAQSSDEKQAYQSAYGFAQQALDLSPGNPSYIINLADSSAKIALISQGNNQSYIDQAGKLADQAVSVSPANINFWKQRGQIYYYLSTLDNKYFYTAVESLLQGAKLAPTDAKMYYSLGKFLETASMPDDAAFYYQKAIDLKSNYDYAYAALGEIFFNQKKYDLAKTNLEQTLKYAPTNTDAQKMLEEIKKLKN